MKKRILKVFIILIILQKFDIYPEIPEKYLNELNQLNEKLIKKGVPENWLLDNIDDSKFQIYYKIENYFKNMAENKVKSKEKDFNWYKTHFNLDGKVKYALIFIEKYKSLLTRLESKNGIHYELIVSIIALESNFADPAYKGKFYTFPTLISQYLLTNRKEYSMKQLVALYKFSNKINKNVYYFIGSFAGACGWGQFIPSSLHTYFIDFHGYDFGIDIYSIEDNLASIENYLYLHDLNTDSIDSFKSRYKAILSYNPSKAYTLSILYLYDKLRKKRYIIRN